MLAVALFNTILEFYNGKIGLFPWGITENGDELFWNFIGDDSIEIVCPIFPDDFILEENYYDTI